jgi:hypothetical protein
MHGTKWKEEFHCLRHSADRIGLSQNTHRCAESNAIKTLIILEITREWADEAGNVLVEGKRG